MGTDHYWIIFLVSDNTFYAITEYTSSHHGQNLSDHNAILHVGLFLILLIMLFSVILTQCSLKVVTGPRPLNSQLSSIVLPVEALHCCDTNCSKHNQSLQAYHESRVNLVQVACQVGLS